jgi:tetratricopeptide (TPR) repeat protein
MLMGGKSTQVLEVPDAMSTILRKSLTIVPVTLFFSFACWGQVSTFEGNVKAVDGKPLPNAVIKIERKDIKGSYKTKTDKKGHYFYGGLPLGVYDVTVEVDGADRITKPGRTQVGQSVDISFDLATAGQTQADESGRALSAKEREEIDRKNKEAAAAMAKNKALNDAFNAGKQAATTNNWDAAIDNFQKASEVDPNQSVVWGNLADALMSRAKTKSGADQQADFQKSGEAYQKAITLKADDAAFHNNYALVLAQQKKVDEAQAEITKAAQLDTTNAGKYYFNLGALYVNSGNSDPAAVAFKKAIELDPNYADAYYQYGLSLMGKATLNGDKMSAPPGTEEAFQKYLQLKPTGPDADAAKAMLQQLGSKLEVNFAKPGAPTKKKQ